MASIPDYSSRDWRLRLFVALAALLGLAAIAERGCTAGRARISAAHRAVKPQALSQPAVEQQEAKPGELSSAWDSVEDDTLLLRPAERDCWLEIEERLRSAGAAELEGQSIGQVRHTQLFHDPDDYRGQVVTVRGTVRYASRGQYYALWIRPEGGPTSPIVVYALELPPGFPRIELSSTGQLSNLHEEVEVTGIFLKRGSYVAEDGPRMAPLIVARSPVWLPGQSDPLAGENGRHAWLWPTVGAALAISAAIVLVVVRRTR
jgi:hypothetical protein